MYRTAVDLSDVSVSGAEGLVLRHLTVSFAAGALHFLTSQSMEELRLLFSAIARQTPLQGGSITFFPHTEAEVFHLSGHVSFPLFAEFSLAENIFFSCFCQGHRPLRRIDYSHLYHQCNTLLRHFALDWDVRAPMRTFSLAQQQLALLLRALVADCPVVLLDEPCALLTENELVTAYQIMGEMRDKGRCVLIATTKLREITTYGDTLTLLDHGALHTHWTDRHQLTESNLLSLLAGNCYLNRYPRRERPCGKTVFQLDHLSVYDVLKDVSFSLHEGEILGVTGLAGSGRSLLCRSLFGLEPCRIQRLTLHGRPVQIHDPASAIQQGLAYLPEGIPDHSLFDNLSVERNLSITSLHRFLRKRFWLDAAFETYLVSGYLEKLHLPSKDAVSLSTLRRGEQQKLLLGRWMMAGASIYILDEPTSGLDVPTKIDLYNMIEDLRHKNCSLLLVGSDMEELLGMCDRILVIAQGRIVLDAHAAQLTKAKLLQAAAS